MHMLHHSENKNLASLTETQSSEKSYSLPLHRSAQVCFCMNKRVFFFHVWDMVTGDSASQIITFFPIPLDVCLLLILHLSQQVDWASVTSYIYIYTCIQHHMYPPNKKLNKKINQNSLFTTLSV